MPRYAYVNGRYVPHGQAAVHVEDRGFQFADGVYEVVTIVRGRMVDEEPHLDRLERSLSELDAALPMARPVLQRVMRVVAIAGQFPRWSESSLPWVFERCATAAVDLDVAGLIERD